jgi:hypothetical protein
MTEIIQNRKQLANKLQIVAVATYKEIDGIQDESVQVLSIKRTKYKSVNCTNKRLNMLPGYNTNLNSRENTNQGFVVRDSGLESRNALITSWGTNKSPPDGVYYLLIKILLLKPQSNINKGNQCRHFYQGTYDCGKSFA